MAAVQHPPAASRGTTQLPIDLAGPVSAAKLCHPTVPAAIKANWIQAQYTVSEVRQRIGKPLANARGSDPSRDR
jgi:hypothetical protein